MRTKHAKTSFKKGDRVRLTRAAIRRVKSNSRRNLPPWGCGKVGEVTEVIGRSRGSKYVVVRFANGLQVGFRSDDIERVQSRGDQ